MGVSTNGEIRFGILFPEDFRFPWDEYGGGIDDWWVHDVCKYEPPFKIYDERGEYIDGVKPSDVKSDEYYEHKTAFAKANPLPVDPVNCCSGDYPMFIIAVPKIGTKCCRGDPTALNFSDFTVTEEATNALIDFCEKYCTSEYEEPEMTPKWYLSSYWG